MSASQAAVEHDLHLQLKLSSFEQQKDKLLVIYKGFTDQYTVPKEFIKRFGKTIIGTVVNFRHTDPKDDVEAFLGKVNNAVVLNEGKELEVHVLLHGDTEFQKNVQKRVEKGELGFSPEILFTYNKGTGQLHKVEFIGGGLTPSPLCEECYPKAMEYMAGEKGMSEQLEKQIKLYEKIKKDLEEKLKDSEALNETFAQKLKAFEDKSKNDKTAELKQMLEKHEAEKAKIQEELDKAKAEITETKTEAIREEIVKIEGLKDEAAEKRKEELKSFTAEQLATIKNIVMETLKTIETSTSFNFPTPPSPPVGGPPEPSAQQTVGMNSVEQLMQKYSMEQIMEMCEKKPGLLENDTIRTAIHKFMEQQKFKAMYV